MRAQPPPGGDQQTYEQGAAPLQGVLAQAGAQQGISQQCQGGHQRNQPCADLRQIGGQSGVGQCDGSERLQPQAQRCQHTRHGQLCAQRQKHDGDQRAQIAARQQHQRACSTGAGQHHADAEQQAANQHASHGKAGPRNGGLAQIHQTQGLQPLRGQQGHGQCKGKALQRRCLAGRDFRVQPHLLAQAAQQTKTSQPRGNAESHTQQKNRPQQHISRSTKQMKAGGKATTSA